jgi:GNAT superfamily N-acetyltransferase
MMKTIILRAAEPERDFGLGAEWFTLLEGEPNSQAGLQAYYAREQARIIQQVATDELGNVVGFYWITRHRAEPDQLSFYLFVRPEQRRQGIGQRLYEEVERAAHTAQATKLRISVGDDCPECRTFAERRGFCERLHQFPMWLDLAAFDERPYDAVIARLKAEGFCFTSMEELGNCQGLG